MIFTDRKITIRNGKSTINEPVILYRGDYEVSIKFTIMESKFRFKSGVNLVDSEKASHGQLAILTPYGDSVISEIVKCEDGTVTFTLTKEMIDQLEEVGLYSFQIRLFDYYRESRISIPPVEFGIEVREPVASEDHNNIVGDGIVGYATAKCPISKISDGLNEDYDGPTFDDDGQYNKTDWEMGDRISQGKLNKIEDAIDQINQNEKTLDKRVTNNFNVLESNKADKNEIFSMANMGQDIKEAMTGGSVAVVGKDGVLRENISDGQVTFEKTDFIETDDTGNLIDMNKITRDVYINGGVDGNLKPYNDFCVTDYIKVSSAKSYYYGTLYSGYYAFYDANKKYISGLGQASNDTALPRPFTPPQNACYIRMTATNFVNMTASYLSTVEGSKDFRYVIPELYFTDEQIETMYEYTTEHLDMEVTEDLIKDGSVTPNKTTFIHVDENSNMINPDSWIADYYYNGDKGEFKAYEGWYSTNYVPVIAGDSYYYGSLYSGHVVFWDKNHNYISGIGITTGTNGLENPFTVPYGAAYITMTALSESSKEDAYISKVQNPRPYSFVSKQLNFTEEQKDIICEHVSDNITISGDQVDFLEISAHKNYYTSVGIQIDSYVQGQTNGVIKNNKGTSATDYIRLKEGQEYYWSYLYSGYMAYYDENKNYITGLGFHQNEVTYIPNPFTVPEGAVYARFTVGNGDVDKAWINTENKQPPAENVYKFNIQLEESVDNPCNFKEDHYISLFNKIACIGDSLTAGTFNTIDGQYIVDARYSWPTFLNKLTGVETVNLGHGGYTSKVWYNQYQNEDLSGYDCAIIQLGVNDVAKAEEQGITDEITLMYLQLIIDKLKAENNYIKIFVAGITKCRWYNSDAYNAKNQLILNFASNREDEDIYCIDLKQYSIAYDRPYASGHLAGLGYLQQAEEYKNYISYLMYKNIDNFINVHFSGTNHTPL